MTKRINKNYTEIHILYYTGVFMKKIVFALTLLFMGNISAMYQIIQKMIAEKAPITQNDQSEFAIELSDGTKVHAKFHANSGKYTIDRQWHDGSRTRNNNYMEKDQPKRIFDLLAAEFNKNA